MSNFTSKKKDKKIEVGDYVIHVGQAKGRGKYDSVVPANKMNDYGKEDNQSIIKEAVELYNKENNTKKGPGQLSIIEYGEYITKVLGEKGWSKEKKYYIYNSIEKKYVGITPKKTVRKKRAANKTLKKSSKKSKRDDDSTSSLDLDNIEIVYPDDDDKSLPELDKEEEWKEFQKDYYGQQIDYKGDSYIVKKSENKELWEETLNTQDRMLFAAESYANMERQFGPDSFAETNEDGERLYDLWKDGELTEEEYDKAFAPKELLLDPRKYFDEVYFKTISKTGGEKKKKTKGKRKTRKNKR